jgi:hypothetical protein
MQRHGGEQRQGDGSLAIGRFGLDPDHLAALLGSLGWIWGFKG